MATVNQLILILGGWTVIISSVVYFISNRVADRLSIKWKETSDSNIAKLQGELTKNNNSLNSLITLYAANYHQAQDRRIKAIEILWINLLQFKGFIPGSGHMVYNIFLEKEIEGYWTSENENKNFLAARNSFLEVNESEHIHKYYEFINLIEKERPFIGERIWLYYDIYKTFLGRIGILLIHGAKNRQFEHWHNDGLIKDLFENTLAKEEVKYIYSIKLSSLKITMAFLENKLLSEVNKTLSGETLSESALERIKKFDKVLSKSKE